MHVISGQGFVAREYADAQKYLFGTTNQVIVNGQRGVIDAYSGTFVPGTGNDGSKYRERGDQNADGRVDSQGMNVEHVWPQSFFNKRAPMKSDVHHLMITFVYPNGMR